MSVKLLCVALLAGLALSAPGLPLNVKDFGAAGDGKADDAPAIVKAIDAAFAPQCPDRSVYFPPGAYRVASTIFLGPERSGLTLGGARSGNGDWLPSIAKLVWDGEKGGVMFDLRAAKALRMEQLILDGANKAATLLRINSIDPKNQDKTWVKKYGQRASTGHNFNDVTLCRAGTGILLNDDAYICSDCSSFVDMNFSDLEVGIDARSEQNLCYLILRPNVGYVKTAFRFLGGGAVDAINVNTHHVDVVFDISKCGINSGIYHLSTVRSEQGGATKGKRPVMLKASGEVNVTMSSVQTTCNGLFGEDADRTTPAFILGPSANVLVQASQISGHVARLDGDNSDVPTFITFENCRFRCFADPMKSVGLGDNSGFRLRDCQITRDELRDGKYTVLQRDFVLDYYQLAPRRK